MRRSLPLVLSLALFVLIPPSASSQQPGPLRLAWDQCQTNGGTTHATFACQTNTGRPYTLIASIVLPVDIPQFAAASVFIHAYVGGIGRAAWWQTALGECRVNAIGMSFDPQNLAESGCPNIWEGHSNAEVFLVQTLGDHPYVLRLSGGAAVPVGSQFPLVADGSELVIARLTIARAKSTGPGACEGCANKVCFAFVESRLQQPAGLGDYWFYWDYFGGSEAYANYSQSPSFGPANTPEPCGGGWVAGLNRTWGAIKTMYR